jgi:hypothetical protein
MRPGPILFICLVGILVASCTPAPQQQGFVAAATPQVTAAEPTSTKAPTSTAWPSNTPRATAVPSMTPTSTALPTSTSTDTPIPTDTATATLAPPTNTPKPTLRPPTATPKPTASPLRELTTADVGLPIDTKQLSLFRYKPCYIFTDGRFHAGDIINFTASPPSEYDVLAPIDGKVITAHLVTPQIGWEISVMTNFAYKGGRVYYDIVHTNGPANGVSVGTRVRKGQPLAVIRPPYNLDPGGSAIVDFALRNSPHKQANPASDNWTGTEYFAFMPWVQDDLGSLPPGAYIETGHECKGSPIP